MSPCVTFNDHVGSTKSYTFTEHYHEACTPTTSAAAGNHALTRGETLPVQMHDAAGSWLRKLTGTTTHDRGKAFEYLRTKLRQGEHVTGLIFVTESTPDMHDMSTPWTCR